MFKIAVLLAFALVAQVSSHGRLWRPVNRSSVWRDPAFASFNPPPNWDDIQLWCGAAHQIDNPGTNCGVCGDPVGHARPRANEFGGTFHRGIITGRYTAGGVIPIEVQLTAAHLGFMEFRLCTSPQNGGETQGCFNQHLLQRVDGQGSRIVVDRGPATYSANFRLPANVRCATCVLQWNYRAGNNWGTGGSCGGGVSGLGCGPQESFRGCSDIAIS